jgi:addiction module HigA family antidote
LGLNVTDGAKVLGVARHTLSRVLNGQAGISAEMAIRLEKAGWSNAEVRRYEHQLPA